MLGTPFIPVGRQLDPICEDNAAGKIFQAKSPTSREATFSLALCPSDIIVLLPLPARGPMIAPPRMPVRDIMFYRHVNPN
jgi:hypothetical protein